MNAHHDDDSRSNKQTPPGSEIANPSLDREASGAGRENGEEGTSRDTDSDSSEDPAVRLLRGALATPPRRTGTLLPGVQDRIRVHTRGRYYRDRWSRAHDPVPLLLVAALLLLIVAALVFVVLQPLGRAPEPVQMPDPPPDPLEAPASNQSE